MKYCDHENLYVYGICSLLLDKTAPGVFSFKLQIHPFSLDRVNVLGSFLGPPFYTPPPRLKVFVNYMYMDSHTST